MTDLSVWNPGAIPMLLDVADSISRCSGKSHPESDALASFGAGEHSMHPAALRAFEKRAERAEGFSARRLESGKRVCRTEADALPGRRVRCIDDFCDPRLTGRARILEK